MITKIAYFCRNSAVSALDHLKTVSQAHIAYQHFPERALPFLSIFLIFFREV